MPHAKIFNTAGSIALLCTLASCGITHDMSEMHDATLKMNATTTEMNKSTKALLTLTTDMSKTMNKMNASMDKTVSNMDQTLTYMKKMSATTDKVAGSTDQMLVVSKDLQKTTHEVRGDMQTMLKTTNNLNHIAGHMDTSMGSLMKTTNSIGRTATAIGKTATQLSNKMSGLQSDMKGMKTDLGNAYTDGRMDTATRSRREALQRMENQTEPKTKLTLAGTYYYAMEFQFWKPERDGADTRQLMFKNMIMEYLGLVQGYADDLESYDVAPLILSDQKANLLALVGTMERVSETQTNALKAAHSTETPESILSLIEKGLRAKALVASGKVKLSQLPAYQQAVLESEPLCWYLLQMRQLYLRAMALMLSYADRNESQGSTFQLTESVVSEWFTTSSHWTANFGNRNQAQLSQIADFVEYSAETAAFLKSFGIKPETSRKVDMPLFRMKIDRHALNSSAKEQTVERISRALDQIARILGRK